MAEPLAAFVQDNLLTIIIVIGMAFVCLLLYRKLRRIPAQPDFLRIYQEQEIRNENLNKPDATYGLRYLYRGHQLLGIIQSLSHTWVNSERKPQTTSKFLRQDQKVYEGTKAKIKIGTVTFKRPVWKFKGLGKTDILRFTEEDDFTEEHSRKALVFPETTAFNCIGNTYCTVNSYPVLSRVLEDNFNKHLFNLNANFMASAMSQIQGIRPEWAFMLEQKRMEIQAAEKAKQMKISGIL
jgi:hypothetical protein